MKLTIITVNRNNSSGLKKTIESVQSQTFADYEYIILDGASTDDSVDIIRRYANPSTIWVSEPDKGVYDAMNKALSMACGEWVCFMNSGDCFHSSDVLNRIFSDYSNKLADAGVVYGDTLNVFSWGNIVTRPENIDKIRRRMAFCHQSSFVRTDLARNVGFDLNFRIAADYNLFYNLYKSGAGFVYMPFIFADYEAEEGISSVNVAKREREYAIISGRHNDISWKFEFATKMFVIKSKQKIKQLVPRKVLGIYRKGKVND